MKNVLIRAPLLSFSGYGVHSRQIFKWLSNRKDVNVYSEIVNWGNTTWMINSEMEDGLIGKIMETSSGVENPDVTFQVQLPDEWDPDLGKFNVGVSAFVETDRCHPSWIDAINKMDLVIVPSTFTKALIENTGECKTPVIVVHESFHDDFANESGSLDIDLDTSFNFLVVGQFTGDDPWNDRKNLFFTIKWICEEFKDDPNVGIILKTNHGRGTRIDRELTKSKVNQIVNEVREGDFPRFHLIHGNLTSKEMVQLYNHKSCKCLVSLTRGEGYGLPLLEASVGKIPVIATNWSGHLDFLGKGKFIPINYSLTQIPPSRIDGRIFLEGFRWAEPMEEDFKKKILKFREKSEKPKEWANELSKTLKSEFSHKKISGDYDNAWSNFIES
jgi:glycosyltransferase involved in cell wall biosynthesis